MFCLSLAVCYRVERASPVLSPRPPSRPAIPVFCWRTKNEQLVRKVGELLHSNGKLSSYWAGTCLALIPYARVMLRKQNTAIDAKDKLKIEVYEVRTLNFIEYLQQVFLFL